MNKYKKKNDFFLRPETWNMYNNTEMLFKNIILNLIADVT